MTIAIRRANGEQFLFDAVTAFEIAHSGSVAENPIERKSAVADHFTHNNPQIRISGVVSGADYNNKVPVGQSFINQYPVYSTPIVGGNNGESLLESLIPESYKWLIDSDGEIPISFTETEDRKWLKKAAEDWLTSLFANKEIVSVLKFESGVLYALFDNYIITDLSFKEDPDSGLALFPEISLKYVRRFSVQSTSLPSELSKKQGTTKGKKQTATKDCEADKTTAASSPSVVRDDAPKDTDMPEWQKLLE